MHEAPGWAVGLDSSWEELSQSFGMEKMVLFGCKGLSYGFLGRALCGSPRNVHLEIVEARYSSVVV